LLQMGCVVSAYKNPSPPIMFKLFSALQTNYVKERCCVFHCLKIQITQFLPSFSCSFTVPDCSLNCCYNSDRHARYSRTTGRTRHAHPSLCVPFINNSLHPKTQGTNYRFPLTTPLFLSLSFFCLYNAKKYFEINVVEI
jgi:hypothetical protein